MYTQPGTIHSDVDPTHEEHVWIPNSVGSGPPVERVDWSALE